MIEVGPQSELDILNSNSAIVLGVLGDDEQDKPQRLPFQTRRLVPLTDLNSDIADVTAAVPEPAPTIAPKQIITI